MLEIAWTMLKKNEPFNLFPRKRSKPIIVTARETARQTMGETVSRREALGRANPAIADQDIIDAKRTRDAVLAAVYKARVRLDALRLVVMGEMG